MIEGIRPVSRIDKDKKPWSEYLKPKNSKKALNGPENMDIADISQEALERSQQLEQKDQENN